MQDLTTGPVTRHLLKTTSFMLVTMVFQTLYFLVDLYWVGRLGTEAVAAVGIAGNLTFIVLALSQMLGVGTTTVVSHAVGRKDHPVALLLFNQSQVLAMVTGILFLIVGLAVRTPYSAAMSADARTAALAGDYLLWFIPAMALQFAMVAMGSALRGVGNFKPGMVVSTATVIINMILAPFLIFGWGTGYAFGVAGAAISSLVAIVIGVVWLATYFVAEDSYLRFVVADWKPRLDLWKKMLAIGLPAGFEFGIMALYLFVVYALARPFGAAAQAGFGIGSRVIQAGFMPVVALGFSVAPVAGQNFGAKQAQRVKATFRDAALMAAGVMVLFAILCHTAPAALVGIFSKDPSVIAVGEEYLRIISWNYVASGLIFVASSMFQAMGNTIPSLVTSSVRITIVAIPAFILSRIPGFQLHWIWYLSVGSVLVQLALSMLLLRREFGRRLRFAEIGDRPQF
ncbi:MAG TPA: MATE family efflux transporter [Acidobacteriota bacterium]|jgi:putative MATE family efflux protein